MPSQFFTQSEPEVEYEEDDDGLGYYLDGVKRTLTDDQIAMFRHSEIQALIKEKEAQAAENEEEHSTGRTSGSAPIFTKKTFQSQNNQQPSRAKKKSRPKKARAMKKLAEAAMEQARRRRNSSSELERPRKKQFPKDDQQDPEDFLSDGDEKTYRRKAREADEIKDNSVELDY